jgi:hypothetical protein
MGGRSIVLLLTFAVLLQPAFASVCMMQCPSAVPPPSVAQPSAAQAAHAHHHHAAAATHDSTASIAAGACNKTMDLHNSAITPTSSVGINVDSATPSPMSLAVNDVPARDASHPTRLSAPIVVPLRI